MFYFYRVSSPKQYLVVRRKIQMLPIRMRRKLLFFDSDTLGEVSPSAYDMLNGLGKTIVLIGKNYYLPDGEPLPEFTWRKFIRAGGKGY